jgi:hypothetical protein
MSSNRMSQIPSSAIYHSPIERAEGWKARMLARFARGGMSKNFRMWLGFIPCRNALVSRQSRASEDNDITADPLIVGVPLLSTCDGIRNSSELVAQPRDIYLETISRKLSKECHTAHGRMGCVTWFPLLFMRKRPCHNTPAEVSVSNSITFAAITM